VITCVADDDDAIDFDGIPRRGSVLGLGYLGRGVIVGAVIARVDPEAVDVDTDDGFATLCPCFDIVCASRFFCCSWRIRSANGGLCFPAISFVDSEAGEVDNGASGSGTLFVCFDILCASICFCLRLWMVSDNGGSACSVLPAISCDPEAREFSSWHITWPRTAYTIVSAQLSAIAELPVRIPAAVALGIHFSEPAWLRVVVAAAILIKCLRSYLI